MIEGKLQNTTSEAISASYDDDRDNPVDSEPVKTADDLAAFMEAYLSLQNGISNPQRRQPFERDNFSTATGRLDINLSILCNEFCYIRNPDLRRVKAMS